MGREALAVVRLLQIQCVMDDYTCMLKIRLTPYQMQAIKAAAKEGKTTVSKMVRALLTANYKEPDIIMPPPSRPAIPPKASFLDEIEAEKKRLGLK